VRSIEGLWEGGGSQTDCSLGHASCRAAYALNVRERNMTELIEVLHLRAFSMALHNGILLSQPENSPG